MSSPVRQAVSALGRLAMLIDQSLTRPEQAGAARAAAHELRQSVSDLPADPDAVAALSQCLDAVLGAPQLTLDHLNAVGAMQCAILQSGAGAGSGPACHLRAIPDLLDVLSRPRRAARHGLPRRVGAGEAQSCLIRRHGSAGDILLTTPAVRALRRRYPQMHLTYETSPQYADLLQNNPDLDALVERANPTHYHRFVDLHSYEAGSAFYTVHPVDYYAQQLDVALDSQQLVLEVDVQAERSADRLLRSYGISRRDRYVVLAPWAREDAQERHWFADRWRELGERLLGAGVKVAILGGNDHPALGIAGAADLTGQTSWQQAAAVIRRALFAVSVDTGLLHVAAAMRTPTVALFGCTSPEVRLPRFADQDVLWHHELRCVPCFHACRRHRECMRAISIEEVWERCRWRLERSREALVSVIIPVHNGAEYLEACLAAVRANTAPEAYEVIVVDDASPDRTVVDVARRHGARVVSNETNAGFAHSCNVGAMHCRDEYLLFLNSDTVPQSGWLPALKRGLRKQVGVVGARLLYPEARTVQHAGMDYESPHGGMLTHTHRHLPGDAPAVLRDRDCAAVTGAVMLLRRRDFFELGGFDERFPHSCEDTDLCLRLGRQGLACRYKADAVLLHAEGGSSKSGLQAKRNTSETRMHRTWEYRLRQGWEKEYLILVSRLASRGDILLTLPMVQALRQRHPRAKIVYQVSSSLSEMLIGVEGVDDIITDGNHPREGYDLVVDLNGAYENHPLKGRLHIVEAFAQRAHVEVDSYAPLYHVTREEAAAARRFLSANGIGRKDTVVGAVLHSAGRPHVDWPEEYWEELADCLVCAGRKVVALGGPGERPLPHEGVTNAVGQLDFRTSAAVLAACDAVVGVDTGPMHVASALGKPRVVLFGMTSPQTILPPAGNWTALCSQTCPNGPCWLAYCPEEVSCMYSIRPDTVWRALERRLRRPHVGPAVINCYGDLLRQGARAPGRAAGSRGHLRRERV